MLLWPVVLTVLPVRVMRLSKLSFLGALISRKFTRIRAVLFFSFDSTTRLRGSATTSSQYTARMSPSFFDSVLQLIVRTSTDLPPDVRAAMKTALGAEPDGSRSSQALTIIAQNIDLAVDTEGAICQDTGMPTFEIKVPVGANQIVMRQQIRDAIAEATRRGKLRPTSVDSITGANSGDNLGPGTPIIHFEQWEKNEIDVKLILKGGGCENTNAQYALPVELPHLGRAGSHARRAGDHRRQRRLAARVLKRCGISP